MLKQPNKNWTIYPSRNFKSNKNKRLHPAFIPQRLNINKVAQTRITKQDHITFHKFGLEFSESVMVKFGVKPYDRVIIYINDKEHRIGFKFYLNRVHKYHKNRDLMSQNTLDAIENNPSIFRDNIKDRFYGYLLQSWHIGPSSLYIEPGEVKYVVSLNILFKKHTWIKPNIQYTPIFDYIHNRWEVRL
jgi:hypothetical protein